MDCKFYENNIAFVFVNVVHTRNTKKHAFPVNFLHKMFSGVEFLFRINPLEWVEECGYDALKSILVSEEVLRIRLTITSIQNQTFNEEPLFSAYWLTLDSPDDAAPDDDRGLSTNIIFNVNLDDQQPSQEKFSEKLVTPRSLVGADENMTQSPSTQPTSKPASIIFSTWPTKLPTKYPTMSPSVFPSTHVPSFAPSSSPTIVPTNSPTNATDEGSNHLLTGDHRKWFVNPSPAQLTVYLSFMAAISLISLYIIFISWPSRIKIRVHKRSTGGFRRLPDQTPSLDSDALKRRVVVPSAPREAASVTHSTSSTAATGIFPTPDTAAIDPTSVPPLLSTPTPNTKRIHNIFSSIHYIDVVVKDATVVDRHKRSASSPR